MRVAFTLLGGRDWTGGYQYLTNLLTALALEQPSNVEPVVFCATDAPIQFVAQLQAIPGTEVHADVLPGAGSRGRRLLRTLLTGRDPTVHHLLCRHRIDAIFEGAEYYGWRMCVPAIAWMADFQHRNLPDQFSRLAYWRREIGFRVQVSSRRVVMLSSFDAASDFKKYYRLPGDRLFVVHFAVLPPRIPDEDSVQEVVRRYGLPQEFFYLPNQFWRHKNHLLVVEALAKLRAKGLEVVVAASGRQMDPRHPEHYRMVEQRIEDYGLGSQFRMLGMIPREDLFALMHASTAVLNPSLSEGWSTTVEEARSLGAPLLLSDLSVHREQAAEDASYFDRYSKDSLARALAEFKQVSRVERVARAQRANALAQERVRAFARDFSQVVQCAVAGRQRMNSALKH
jgi:glycosyltransferase involved in cell wall biosynthesis